MAKINERSFIVLLEEHGPVGRDLDQVGLDIVELARDNIRTIMERYQGNMEALLDAVDYRFVDALTIQIGIRDDGSISRYLSDKEDREEIWLKPAAEQVIGEH